MFKKLPISITATATELLLISSKRDGQKVEVLHPELLKVNRQEELSIFLACVCLKHCAFSCLVPLESTFSKASNSCKRLMERGVFGLGLFWFFSRHKINNPTTCFGGSLLRLKEGLGAHQGITSPSEHCRVSPYLCPGFRLRLCAWLHCALLLQGKKGKKFQSQ